MLENNDTDQDMTPFFNSASKKPSSLFRDNDSQKVSAFDLFNPKDSSCKSKMSIIDELQPFNRQSAFHSTINELNCNSQINLFHQTANLSNIHEQESSKFGPIKDKLTSAQQQQGIKKQARASKSFRLSESRVREWKKESNFKLDLKRSQTKEIQTPKKKPQQQSLNCKNKSDNVSIQINKAKDEEMPLVQLVMPGNNKPFQDIKKQKSLHLHTNFKFKSSGKSSNTQSNIALGPESKKHKMEFKNENAEDTKKFYQTNIIDNQSSFSTHKLPFQQQSSYNNNKQLNYISKLGSEEIKHKPEVPESNIDNKQQSEKVTHALQPTNPIKQSEFKGIKDQIQKRQSVSRSTTLDNRSRINFGFTMKPSKIVCKQTVSQKQLPILSTVAKKQCYSSEKVDWQGHSQNFYNQIAEVQDLSKEVEKLKVRSQGLKQALGQLYFRFGGVNKAIKRRV